jgi:hypothetical protein
MEVDASACYPCGSGQVGSSNVGSWIAIANRYSTYHPTAVDDDCTLKCEIFGYVVGGLMFIDGGGEEVAGVEAARGVGWVARAGGRALGRVLGRSAGKEAAEDAGAVGKVADAAKSCLNSFTADTPVTLADGAREPIKDVQVGVRVLASDPKTGQTKAEPVLRLIRHSGSHAMVGITLADGSVLYSTDRHPIWDVTTGRFTVAGSLHVGEAVETSRGAPLRVVGLSHYRANLTAYNLEVAQIHTYYAGATPVLVHNSCSPLEDALATRHGQEQLARRGFDAVDVAIVRASSTAYEQADGAIAHVGQLGRDSYNVVVVGGKGIVTAIRDVSRQELNHLARTYKWSGYP